MKITPMRNMLLDGKHLQEGKTVNVSDAAARLAIMRGWAVEPKARAKADAEAEAAAAAQAEAPQEDAKG